MRRAFVLFLVIAGCGGDDTAPLGAGGSGDDASASADTSTPDDANSVSDSGAGTDASTDTGGSPDAGRDFSTNRAAFFGASRCAQAGVQLCEDFEGGTLDTATWTVVSNNPKPVVDGLQHARGTKALHIVVNGNGASYIKETKTFPAQNDTYWGRIFVWFESLPAAPLTYAHWTFAAASGTGVQGEIRLSGQLQNGKNLFGVGTDSGGSATGTGDWTNSDKDPNNMPLAVPTKEWLCIEWLHSGATNETRFFWDAVEHPSLHTTSTMHGGNTNPYVMPQFTNAWIGWQEYQTTNEKFEMWIDEIAIDASRIGCVL